MRVSDDSHCVFDEASAFGPAIFPMPTVPVSDTLEAAPHWERGDAVPDVVVQPASVKEEDPRSRQR